VGGWSAGGNLALSVSMMPALRRRIRAAVPIYPVVDFATPHEAKARARRYKPALGGFRGNTTDFLSGLASVFDWSYVPAHQSLEDPLLSPAFAEAADLPPGVFIVACELDMLADEAWRMARALVGRPLNDEGGAAGQEACAPEGQLVLDSERFAFEERTGRGSCRWLLVPDTIHGFDQMPPFVKDEACRRDAKAKTAAVQKEVAAWLFREAFKVPS
jgi:acetyl esterase/lipase